MISGVAGAIKTRVIAKSASGARACSSIGSTPLDVELPGIPQLKRGLDLAKPRTQVTTLSNGFRVASEEMYGQVSTMGVFLDAGSADETTEQLGTSKVLENLAFGSSYSRSQVQISNEMRDHGISLSAAGSRDVMMYRAECIRGDVERALAATAETILQPKFTDREVEDAIQIAQFQHMDMLNDPAKHLQEAVHAAAYGPSTPFGRQFDPTSLDNFNVQNLHDFRAKHMCAPRMVLAAAGVDHDELVALAEKYFSDLPSHDPRNGKVRPPPVFKGQMYREPLKNTLPLPVDLTHISIAFPTVGWEHKDIVVVALMDTLLGGGSAFSSGGPGKGMYSRLFLEVLNRHGWVEGCHGWSLTFGQAGIFGIYGSCPPPYATYMFGVIYQQLGKLATQVCTPEELNRAKKQLRSSIFFNLESRAILCEDIGRQMVMLNKRITGQELGEMIEQITAEDLMRVAATVTSAPPAMAVVGDAANVPRYQVVKDAFQNPV